MQRLSARIDATATATPALVGGIPTFRGCPSADSPTVQLGHDCGELTARPYENSTGVTLQHHSSQAAINPWGGEMTISEDLIDRLATETGSRLLSANDLPASTDAGQRLTWRARLRRRRALEAITECCVTVTEDGHTTWQEVFSRPPTLGDLVDRVGNGAFVVSVSMRRKSLRRRVRETLIAA